MNAAPDVNKQKKLTKNQMVQQLIDNTATIQAMYHAKVNELALYKLSANEKIHMLEAEILRLTNIVDSTKVESQGL